MSTRYRGPGQKYDLPESFLLYPAQTWPYKNHLALLEGLALLQEQYDMRPQLICTGRVDRDVWPQLARAINRFGLTDRVRFVGFVPDAEIRAFYRLALALCPADVVRSRKLSDLRGVA